MQREGVIRAVMGHFRSVDHLHMIDVEWFNPSCRSTRTVARFLSSVTSLTLNDVGFYSGPRGLIWMLDHMPRLDVLLMFGIRWPEQRGMPNNPPALLVLALNAYPYFPLLFVPLSKGLMWWLKVKERFRPPTSNHRLHKPLRKLAVNILEDKMDGLCFHWLLAQADSLASITTLMVSVGNSQEQTLRLQSLLDAIESLCHLTIHDRHDDSEDLAAMPSPTLTEHRALESLQIRIHLTYLKEPQLEVWVRRLKNILQTADSSCLTVIRLTIETYMDDFISILAHMAHNLDDYLSRLPHLRQLRIHVYLPAGWGYSENIEGPEGLVRVAFERCEAKGTLRVKATRGVMAEGDD